MKFGGLILLFYYILRYYEMMALYLGDQLEIDRTNVLVDCPLLYHTFKGLNLFQCHCEGGFQNFKVTPS